MIPQLNEEQLKAFPSRAEARFYEACRDRLPEDLVVIYSANTAISRASRRSVR